MTSMSPSSGAPGRLASTTAVVLLVAAAAAGCGTGPEPDTRVSDRLPAAPIAGKGSAWRLDVSDAPVASTSAAQVAHLASQVSSRYGGVAAFNNARYTVAYYRVGKDVARQDVAFDDCQGKGETPAELYDKRTGPFRSVPIPAGAVGSPGTDGELTIDSPATDQLWDLWKAHEVDGRWHACWGGRIDHFSTNSGYYPGYTGASASGTAVEAGTLGLKEARTGEARHALTLAVPEITQQVSYPARRSDGVQPAGTPGGIPMGTRFRLDPGVDVDALDLTPIGKVVARTAQRYGFVVTDSSGAVSVTAERGPVTKSGTSAWAPLMRGVPDYQILRNFPWDKLQALPVDYGKP